MLDIVEGSQTVGEEERAFLQRRVALFGGSASALYLGFYLYRLAIENVWTAPDMWWHLAGGLALALVWMVCRGQARSVIVIRLVETTGLLVAAACIVVMGNYIPYYGRPDTVLIQALAVVITARAVFVPSSPRRTLMLALIIGAMICMGVYVFYLKFEPEKWSVVDPSARNVKPRDIALFVTLNAGAWWMMFTAITTAASRVIFGLRKEVRDAKQLGQYRLVKKLGEGGMGEVYCASHALLRRPTAIKLLKRNESTELSVSRFEKEVQLTAQLNHPNIITIFDYGHTAAGVFYYAMELLDGFTLAELVNKTGPVEPARAAAILHQVAAALVCAHGAGLIHRDIKPANIMLTLPHKHGGANEQVRLLDFGLVREIESGDNPALTQKETISGTPQYMSPESILSPQDVDHRSDIYAVGAVAYFLLTAKHVFEGSTVVEVCGSHLHAEPPPLSERLGRPLPDDFCALVLKCLAKSPMDRPQAARELQLAVEALSLQGGWSQADTLDWWQNHQNDSERQPATTVATDLTLQTRPAAPIEIQKSVVR